MISRHLSLVTFQDLGKIGREEVMRQVSQFLIAIALWISVGGQSDAPAQGTPTSSPQKEKEREQSLRIITNEVRLPLRAFDPMGRRVTDLTAKEVLVIEGGAACLVTGLKREPANIMVVLDLSNNLGVFKSRLMDKETSEKLFEGPNYSVIPRPIAREFAEIVLRQLIPRNQIAMIQYSDRVELLQDWTRSRVEAIRNLRAGFRAGLKARFYDALTLAATRLQHAPPGRRVLVLLTDGLDSASVAAKQSAFEQVLATGASIYVLSWTSILLGEKKRFSSEMLSPTTFKGAGEIKRFREQAGIAAADLQKLASKSGGDYWQPAIVSELMLQTPSVLVDEIDSEYTLTYISNKDEFDRATILPEILLARPGFSVITQRAVKVKR